MKIVVSYSLPFSLWVAALRIWKVQLTAWCLTVDCMMDRKQPWYINCLVMHYRLKAIYFFLPLTGCIENLKSAVDCMMDRKQPWYIAWSCITDWRPYNIPQPKLLVSRELEEINLVPDLCTQPHLLLAVKLSVNMHTTFIEGKLESEPWRKLKVSSFFGCTHA